MSKIYLTRHGETFASRLCGFNPNARKILYRDFKHRLNREALASILGGNEEKMAEYLVSVNLPLTEDFEVGDELDSCGNNLALRLGRCLMKRGDIDRFKTFVPTKRMRPILRNLETAEGIQKGFNADELGLYELNELTELLGDFIPTDSERIPEIVDRMKVLEGRIVVLNAGVLEGVVRHCGGSVDEFGYCGLAVFGCGQAGLVLDENYRSLEELELDENCRSLEELGSEVVYDVVGRSIMGYRK